MIITLRLAAVRLACAELRKLATPRRSRLFVAKVAAVNAAVFGLGPTTIVVELPAHGIRHLPAGVAASTWAR